MEETDPPDRFLTSQQRFEDFASGTSLSTKRRQVGIDSFQPKKEAAGIINEGRVDSGESVPVSVDSNTNTNNNVYVENTLKEYKVLVNVSKAYTTDKLISKN